MKTVRIILRTEVPEDLAEAVIARFSKAAEPLTRKDGPIKRSTLLNVRTIEWQDDKVSGKQVAARKVI